MRYQLLKLKKDNSTHAERKFAEILKELHIPFKTKVVILEREVDFLIGNTIVEISGHKQDIGKNKLFMEVGYNLINYENSDITNVLLDKIKQNYGRNKHLWGTPNNS